jgi:hypothetical protein
MLLRARMRELWMSVSSVAAWVLGVLPEVAVEGKGRMAMGPCSQEKVWWLWELAIVVSVL